MKLRKVLIIQLVLILLIGLTACENSGRKSKETQDDPQYETIINKLFSDEDKETKDYLNSLVIKNVGKASTDDLTFSIDELIYDSATGMGAYQLIINSKNINLSTMKNNLPDYYAFICEDFKLELCDGMLPLDIATKVATYEKELFRNYKYEVINDNEICIWGPYAEGDTFDINVEYFQKSTKRLKLDLPQENNHLTVNVDNDDVIGVYISPIGINVHYKVEQNKPLNYVNSIVLNYKDGKRINGEDILCSIGTVGGSSEAATRYVTSGKYIILDDIESITVDGKEYIPE